MSKKESKAAPIFWAIVACCFAGIYVVMCLIGAIFVSPLILLLGIIPGTAIGFLIYFLLQRLHEIDEEEKRGDEYDKY